MRWDLLVAQAYQKTSEAPPAIKKKSRPPGQIISGSTTDMVFALLKRTHGYLTHAQIAQRVGRSRGAVNWALVYLVKQQKIVAVSDAKRNPRYFKYKLKVEE